MSVAVRTTAAFVLLATAFRIPGLFTEFWLDEIWALRTMESVHAVTAIFTGIHRDVNHYLISLWMFVVGSAQPFWVYRIPSLVAGVIAVIVAGRVASLERTDSSLAMLFVAVSAPLVIYASEARGYSIAAAASLTALLTLIRWTQVGDLRWLVGYWLAMAIGVLAHLSFVFMLGPTTAVLLVLLVRDRITPAQAALVQSVPTALLGWLFLVDLRYLQLAGGQPRTLATLLAQSGALGLGWTARDWSVWVFGIACAVVVIVELIRRLRQWQLQDDARETRVLIWTFCLVAFLFPLAAIVLTRQSHFYARYLLVSLVFVPVLGASLAGAMPRGWRRAFAAAFLIINLFSLAHFWRDGRGQYTDALVTMLRTSTSPAVTVSSDYPLNRLVVEFYRGRLAGGSRLQYVDGDAEFWIATTEPQKNCEGCMLIGTYPASTVAGTTWIVYRRR